MRPRPVFPANKRWRCIESKGLRRALHSDDFDCEEPKDSNKDQIGCCLGFQREQGYCHEWVHLERWQRDCLDCGSRRWEKTSTSSCTKVLLGRWWLAISKQSAWNQRGSERINENLWCKRCRHVSKISKTSQRLFGFEFYCELLVQPQDMLLWMCNFFSCRWTTPIILRRKSSVEEQTLVSR